MFPRIFRNSLLILSFLPFLAAAGCAQLEAQRTQIAAQEQTIKKLQGENKEFQDAYYKIKEQFDNQGTQSQKSAEQLTRDLEQARTQRTQNEKTLGTQLQSVTAELAKLKTGSQEEKLQLQTQIAQLQQNVTTLTMERNTALARQQETDAKLLAEQARTTSLTQQMVQVRSEARLLGNQVVALKKSAAEREDSLTAEKEARQTAEKQVAAQAAQLADQAKKFQDAQAKLTEQGKQAADQAKQLADLKLAGQNVQTKLTDQARQLQDAQAKLTAQGNQLKDAQTQLAAARKKAEAGAATQSELDQLKKDKDALTTELAAAKTKYEKDLSATKALYGVIGAPAEDPELKRQAEALQEKIKGITVKLDGRGLRLIVPNALLFEENKTILADRAAGVLSPISQALNEMGDRPVRVEGHTDDQLIPDLPYADNWGLGLARADRVREFLMKDGKVDGKRLTALSRAQFEPLASNETAEGRKQNRRVEIVVGAKK